MCKLFYPNYFTREKWKYVDTVEEDSKYLSDCNTKNGFYKIMDKEWIKWKYVVTVDEACKFFSECHMKNRFTNKKKEDKRRKILVKRTQAKVETLKPL